MTSGLSFNKVMDVPVTLTTDGNRLITLTAALATAEADVQTGSKSGARVMGMDKIVLTGAVQ